MEATTLESSWRPALNLGLLKELLDLLPSPPRYIIRERQRWLNPTASIGRHYQPLSRGRLCWEAVGPARELLTDVCRNISGILSEQLDEGEEIPHAVSVVLFMTGSRPDEAQPTIIVCCSNDRICKRAIDIIKRSGILADYEGVKLGRLLRSPQPLGSEVAMEMGEAGPSRAGGMRGDARTVYTQSWVVNPCGALIFIRTAGPSLSMRTATMGGVVAIDGSYYGMTACHASAEARYNRDLSDDNAKLIIEDKGNSGGKGVRGKVSSLLNRDPKAPSLPDSGRSVTGTNVDNNSDLVALGTKLDSPDWKNEDLDWELFRIDNSSYRIPNRLPPPWQDIVPTWRVLADPPEGDVLVATGTGIVLGHISATPFFLRMPGRKEFQETWVVDLERRSAVGDCGSWVISSVSGDVYGHIIAGDRNLAYIIPAPRISYDIEVKLGGKITQEDSFPSQNPQTLATRPQDEECTAFEIIDEAATEHSTKVNVGESLPVVELPVLELTGVELSGVELPVVESSPMSTTEMLSWPHSVIDQRMTVIAIPEITNQFHSLSDVGWYGSSYFLSAAVGHLGFRKVYMLWPSRYGFIGAVGIFTLGTGLCTVSAPSFIIGRTLTGLGGAGILGGISVIATTVFPKHMQLLCLYLTSVAFAVALTGSLLAGFFVDHTSWKMCYYIDIAVGSVLLFLCRSLGKDTGMQRLALERQREKHKLTEWCGVLLLIPCSASLFFALQWGGSKYSWSNPGIISLLIAYALLQLALFILLQPLLIALLKSTKSSIEGLSHAYSPYPQSFNIRPATLRSIALRLVTLPSVALQLATLPSISLRPFSQDPDNQQTWSRELSSEDSNYQTTSRELSGEDSSYPTTSRDPDIEVLSNQPRSEDFVSTGFGRYSSSQDSRSRVSVIENSFAIAEPIPGSNQEPRLRPILEYHLSAATVGASVQVINIYLPIWLQAIRGTSAFESGVTSLPFVFGYTLFSHLGCAGAIRFSIGYLRRFILTSFCLVIAVIGTGLLTTLRIDSVSAKYFGFQLLCAYGVGWIMLLPSTILREFPFTGDFRLIYSTVAFAESLGGAVGIAASQSAFLNSIRSGLEKADVSPSIIFRSGATNLKDHSQLKDKILEAYNTALNNTNYVPIAVGCWALLLLTMLFYKKQRLLRPIRSLFEDRLEILESGRA